MLPYNTEKDYLKDRPGRIKIKFYWQVLRYTMPWTLAIIGFFACSQDFGNAMNGDVAVVGEPLLIIFGHDIYNPVYFVLSIFKYIYYEQFIPYYLHAMSYFLIFGVMALAVAVFWTIIINYWTKKEGNFQGTARFATKKDLKKNGMLKKQGVVCGELESAKVDTNKQEETSLKMKLKKEAPLICHTGKVNTLLLGGTGEGKGVSIINPTLLSYPNSIIVYDPKGELYEATSRYRSSFSRIIKFAPTENDTMRYNPVEEMRDGREWATRDTELLANILFAPAKGEGDENSQYFTKSGEAFVIAALMHVRYSDYPDKSLRGIRNFFAGGNEAELEALMAGGQQEASGSLGQAQVDQILHTKHFFIITQDMYTRNKDFFDKRNLSVGDRWYDPELQKMVLKGASGILQTNAKERASVWKTVATKLQPFDDYCVGNATETCDFSIYDFMQTDKPITLYLCVPYSELDRIKAVFRLIITTILKRLTEGGTSYGKQKLPYNILFILDEFPTLGSFPVIAEQMGVLRGYGVFFLIACQALNQLEDRYGQHHPFLDHCTVHIIFAPGDVKDAELFSKRIGNETVHQMKTSRSGGLKIANDNNINYSDQDMSRALLDPADIMRLPSNMSIIMVKGMQPYLAKKVVYYADSRFKDKPGAPLTMKELYREAAGLPCQKRKKERIQQRLLEQANTIEIIHKDDNNPVFYNEIYDVENSDLAEQIIDEILQNGFPVQNNNLDKAASDENALQNQDGSSFMSLISSNQQENIIYDAEETSGNNDSINDAEEEDDEASLADF